VVLGLLVAVADFEVEEEVMRRGMKVLADKFKDDQESKGKVWGGGKSKAAYYRWFLQRIIAIRDIPKEAA
jgi:hypothetical protein